jgi:hypothetical protein
MADDRMRNDERNMGGAGQNKEDYGRQQTPGRKDQDDDLRTGQRGTGQGQENQPGHIKDDFGTSGKKGVGQGGHDRENM